MWRTQAPSPTHHHTLTEHTHILIPVVSHSLLAGPMTDREHAASSSLHPLPLHTSSLFAPVSADVLWPRSMTTSVSGFLGSGVVQSLEDLYSAAAKCSYLYGEAEEV